MRCAGVVRLVCVGLLLAGPRLHAQSQNDLEARVRLLTPISTETNRRGDKITAQVLSPDPYTGSMMEGQIRESRSSGRLKGTSSLAFTFEQLHHADQIIPVRCSVSSVTNSQGAPNVDEEGRVVKQQNGLAKTAAVAGIGALIGAALGGAQGAAIGAGVGAAASLVLIQTATEGANVTFDSGSEFALICTPNQ